MTASEAGGSAAASLGLDVLPFLRLLQVASPSLPIGAYAYSQGLEMAVERGWLRDETTVRNWIGGLFEHSVCRLDLPILWRMHRAWTQADAAATKHWNETLLASRESGELQAEELHLGSALERLLVDLGIHDAERPKLSPRPTYLSLFALWAVHFGAPDRATIAAYAYAWAEHQVGAATRSVPLGQAASQRVLSAVIEAIPQGVAFASSLSDDEIGFLAPGLAIASSWHETQYSRLFRS